ncbi:MAG TPA: 2-(1,2-epoxy-1,2-dihydrophenyl)acetyl-CoA isomerase PaaG [Burkholderiales bacterium]|nr:2-(1,2-epoxy-1,2-dihydrophenyl)acetyl-CoA isomerase PaaG [Burkholderiales bacterium]
MTALLVSLEGGVQRLTLNRPDKLNAFNPELLAALGEAFAQAQADPAIRAVLLTGAGRGFCAGADLDQRDVGADAPPMDLGAGLEKVYNPLIRRMRALEKPIVCAVNGIAAGAGTSLAFACDIVLAARSAAFLQAFARIGLVPDAGATHFLPRLVGSARAMGMALLAEPLSAEDAERWGLVWRCVDDVALMAEAEALAQKLAGGPTRSYGLIKRALYASAGNTLDAQLDLERDLQREAGATEDFREGVRAFKEKRKARYQGR